MACTSCGKNKQAVPGAFTTLQRPYPFNANDINVVDKLSLRRFTALDWDNEKHKLLIFIPETFTPVCKTEIGALQDWFEQFKMLNCDVIICGTDSAMSFLDWYIQEEQLQGDFLTFSSYLLPSRLGLLENGRVKRSSVFVMTDGTVVKQEHFHKVGRSFAELHRMLYGYTTDSYCAEGWNNPEDGFLIRG